MFRAAVLLFLWLLAMAAGIVFKRFMMGAKGWEQIPLLDWYKAFGNLEAVSLLIIALKGVNEGSVCAGWL